MTMITLALAQLVFFFAVQLPFTGGEDGLQGVRRDTPFGFIDLSDNIAMYFFAFAVFCLGFWTIHRTVYLPFGQVHKAIRANEPRAISLGYDVARYKLLAFVLSAAISGVAGGMKSIAFQLASLTDVHWHLSGEVVLMSLFGGLGTIVGPAVGALIIVTLENQLADKVGPWVTVIMGVIFVVCVLSFLAFSGFPEPQKAAAFTGFKRGDDYQSLIHWRLPVICQRTSHAVQLRHW